MKIPVRERTGLNLDTTLLKSFLHFYAGIQGFVDIGF